MFEDATFHSRGILPSQTPKWMLLTLALNLTVLAALMALPILHPDTLPTRMLFHTLFAPAPPPAAAQPVQRAPQSATARTTSLRNPFEAPRRIPPTISTTSDALPVATDLPFNPNAIPGADGPPNLFHAEPPPAVKPTPTQPKSIVLSKGVTEGLLISKPAPTYPTIALAAHVSGTVVLAATISTAGTIKNLRVVSGHPMLQSAALSAVQNWRYHPYQLNNQPVEVETTINVVFSLGSH
jgi:protein TonB